MALTESDLLRFLLSAGLLLLFAVAVGELFARRRQPRVIGEILGGAILGPTVFGAAAPHLQAQLFPEAGPSVLALDVMYQLGLIWLMFATGTELRRLPIGGERVTTFLVAAAGTVLPFAIGLGIFLAAEPAGIAGAANDKTALALVFAAAIAVTSIPVISRILLDLGLMRTAFARVVLGAAILEDIVMFAVLGVAVGIVQSSAGSVGLSAELGIEGGSALSAIYYLCAVSAALAGGAWLGRHGARQNSLVSRIASDVRSELLFVFGAAAACMLINVPPLFGGLVAGLALGGSESSEATNRIKSYGLAFFVPIYFGIVGMRLDLIHAFSLTFFAAFFLLACLVKAGSVYLGARLAGQPPVNSGNLAIAMNARGGPGIILATVALDAGIINGGFYASLVMLAVISSLVAGWWLERVLAPRIHSSRMEAPATPRERAMQPVADLGTP